MAVLAVRGVKVKQVWNVILEGAKATDRIHVLDSIASLQNDIIKIATSHFDGTRDDDVL